MVRVPKCTANESDQFGPRPPHECAWTYLAFADEICPGHAFDFRNSEGLRPITVRSFAAVKKHKAKRVHVGSHKWICCVVSQGTFQCADSKATSGAAEG